MGSIKKFSDAEFQAIFDIQYKKSVAGKKSEALAKAYILGGQPGAGKSTLIQIIKEKLQQNVVVISGDDYRKSHPHFRELYAIYGDEYVNHTAIFSSRMVEKLIDSCSKQGYHLIVEGTMRNYLTPLNTGKLLMGRGYEINLAVMAVPPALSYMGTLTRYETMLEIGTIPRLTTKEWHDKVAKLIVENIGKIYETGQFENILIYNRNQECLYDYSKTPGLIPKEIMQREHKRILTMEEQIRFRNDYEKIRSDMIARGDVKVDELEQQFTKKRGRNNRENRIG